MPQQLAELHRLLQLGELDQAAARCDTLLKSRSQDANLVQLRGGVAYRQGRFAEAVTWFERAVALAPNEPFHLNNLGLALQAVGRLVEAANAIRAAIALQPPLPVFLTNLANILNQLEQYSQAEALSRAALQSDPMLVDAYINLGAALSYQGLSDQAESCFQRAAELAPDNVEVRRNLAHVHQETGRFEAAAQEYEWCLAQDPTDGDAWCGLTSTRRFGPEDEAVIERLGRVLKTPDLPPSVVSDLHQALGKVRNDRGEYDAAFAEFTAAKQVPHEPYDHAAFQRRFDSWIAATPRERREPVSAGSHLSQLPVFIVGMPRSGSTLLEQILGAHPDVYPGGELNDLKAIMTGQPGVPSLTSGDPQSLAEIPAACLQAWSQWYLARRRILAGSAERVTDKMPVNFMFLRLIAEMFPNARVIHVCRQPLDCCVSIFTQRFVIKPEYGYSLADIGRFYREYERLMAHWQSVLPLRMIDVQYEELVEQPHPVVRELLEFLDLPWDARCLRFHEQRRAVQTASSWQVRQPLGRSAVGRWRNYEAHLQPLFDALGDSAKVEPVIRQFAH
ncbi:MAG: sulfotransferase [Planctomycetaceae bacterium]|nr:sulfotransferase [Planctomycetaceae bacterium]